MALIKIDSHSNEIKVIDNQNDQQSVIKLDLNSRNFDGPIGYTVAVMGDNNSQVLTFETEKEFDGVDLYGTSCLLTYWTSWLDDDTPPKHSQGMIDLTSTMEETDEGKLQFKWYLDKRQTGKAGYCKFMITFIMILDEDYYYTNTKDAAFKTVDGKWVIERTTETGETEIVTYPYYSLSSTGGTFTIEDPKVDRGEEQKIVLESDAILLLQQLVSKIYIVENNIGDIDSALNEIIEIQNELIGGGE